MENEVVNPEEEDKGRLYWFFKNTSTRFSTWLKAWVKKHWILSIILALVLVELLFTGRSSYHIVFLSIRKYFLLCIILFIIAFLCFRWFNKSELKGKVVSFLVFAGLIAASWFFGTEAYSYVGLWIHYNKLEKVELTDLPLTGHERVQPLNSIWTLVRQEALSETEDASSPDFVRRKDGTYDFTQAVGPSPEYIAQILTKNLSEVISVSATAPAPDFSAKNRHEVNFDVGEFLLFSKKTKYAAIKRFNFLQYFSYEPAEARFMENDKGEWVQVVSLIRWVGWLIPRPVFGGLLVIEQEESNFPNYLERLFLGRGEWINPEDVKKHSFLIGQNLMPECVTRFTAESFRFQEGFLAPLPGYHEGDIRIPTLPKDQNQMPFVAYFDFRGTGQEIGGKLCDYYGLEPFQESKRGLNTSLFIPSDGQETVYFIDHSEGKDGLIGSSAIPSKIIESRKNYDWSTNHPVESRPFIKEIDGKRRFLWLSTVVTATDSAVGGFIGGSVPDITLTDAHYGQVVWVDKESIGNTKEWVTQTRKEMEPFWVGE